MSRFRILLSGLLLLTAVLACAAPFTAPQVNQAATVAAETLQAPVQITPFASPVPTETPVPTQPALLLPRSLYYLNNDKDGRMQIFRIQPDGKTVNQITFEPAPVDSFDVSPKDGSVAYASNNQLFLVDANGAGRRVLVDGGAVDDSTRFTNTVGTPVWSPDGGTIAFSHDGLNFYTLSNGAVDKVLENQIDTSSGFPIVHELYSPSRYSPDGNQLLINIGFYEGGTFGIYHPSNNALVRFNRPDGQNVCCFLDWVPAGSGLYATSPTIGMFEPGLYYIDAVSGNVTTLLPGSAPDGTYNFADSAQVGPDGRLYFFFNNVPAVPTTGHTPLYLVRSDSDGVTGRTQLRSDVFQEINEILWAPDASLAIVALAPAQDVYIGGQAVVVYPDSRPTVVLTSFAEQMRWGP